MNTPMTIPQIVITIVVIILGTVLTRFLPYIAFPEGRKVPDYILYLGKVLAPAVFGMLVVYCLKNTDFLTGFSEGGSHGIPEALAMIVIIASFLWKKSMLLSMAAGTLLYMALMQLVF